MEFTINKGNKTALLFGASGLIGGFCLRLLVESPVYEKVICFGRKELSIQHEKLSQHIINFDELYAYEELIKGDDLFYCIGTTIKKAGSKAAFRKVDLEYPLEIAVAASLNDVGQLILVSAVGADSNSLIFYNHIKGELEKRIKRLNFWSIHIMQPAILLGERKENRPLERVGMIVSQGLNSVIGNLLGKYKPVNAEDVAKAMIIAAQNLKKGIHIYPSDSIVQIGSGEKKLIR